MIPNDHHHCEDLLDLLNDYLDGELSVAECAELEAHLRECPECQSLLASLRQTISSFISLKKPLPRSRLVWKND